MNKEIMTIEDLKNFINEFYKLYGMEYPKIKYSYSTEYCTPPGIIGKCDT